MNNQKRKTKHEQHGCFNPQRLLMYKHTPKLLVLNPKLINSTNILPLETGEIRVVLR